MGDGRSLRVSIALACVVHAGAIAAVRRAPERSSAGTPVSADAETALFEVEEEKPVVDGPPVEGDSVAVGGVVARAAGRRAGAGAGLAPGSGLGADGAGEKGLEAPEVVTGPQADGWSFQAARVDLGIDPRKRPLLAQGGTGAEAPVVPGPGPASRTGGLTESLDAQDVARGLGRGGAVNTAVHDAVQASSVMGTAIFAVTIDAAGKVTVGVSSASQDELGWAKLNDAIRASVVARKEQLRLPPGGIRIAVQAEAHEQYPNGARPKDMGTRGVAKGPSVTETKDKVDIHLPELAVVHRGKVCDVAVSPIPPFIAGGCDPSNIGAVAQRIVTAHVVSETRL